MQNHQIVSDQTIPKISFLDTTSARAKGPVIGVIESRYGAVLIPSLFAFFFSIRETVIFMLPRLTETSSVLPLDIVLSLIGTVGVLYAVGSVVSIARAGVGGRLEKYESYALLLYSIGVLVIIAQPALHYWDLPNTGLAFYHNALLPVLFFTACIVAPHLRMIDKSSS